MPQAYPILDTPRGRSAFRHPDPEGAPDRDGRTYHAATDWFAPGGHAVKSPVDGSLVEVRASRGNTGQIFGGVVKVRERASGLVYVMRHMDPGAVGIGEIVKAGQVLGAVTEWRDGPDHVHLEVWRTLSGGYRVPNMIDPDTITWTTEAAAPAWPPPHGNSLRLQLPGHPTFAGWGECLGPMRNIARNGLKAQGCRIHWRQGTWTGPTDVANVCRRLLADHT